MENLVKTETVGTQQISNKVSSRRLVGISRVFDNCSHCGRNTTTIVRIINGKIECTCMHCNGLKKEPRGQLIRY